MVDCCDCGNICDFSSTCGQEMNTKEITDRVTRRIAIERIITRYPDISENDLRDVLDYFRHEASALDQATIASNDDIYAQYKALCADHHLERLKSSQIAIIAFAAVVVVGTMVTWAMLF
jgi:hypothetical protein